MSTVDEVVHRANVKRPIDPPASNDWRKLEDDLCLSFPSDFKSLVSELGSGWFGNGLRLLNPIGAGAFRLSHASLIEHANILEPYLPNLGCRLFPDPKGMVLVASIDAFDFYFIPGTEEITWTSLNSEMVVSTDLTISALLLALHRGLRSYKWMEDVRPAIWPEREGEPFFTPAKISRSEQI